MITKATLTDVPQLNQLINAAYRGDSSKKGWTTEADLLEGVRTTETELSTIITTPNQWILKFEKEKILIGSVLIIAKEKELYLGMLTVSPELQNNGIGKKLLIAAENQARSLNLDIIQMTVIAIREELLEWYKRNGYQDTGRREPFPFTDKDKVLTSKPLDFIVLEKKILL